MGREFTLPRSRMLRIALGVVLILLGTVEWMGWWPESATLDARSHRMLRP